MRGQFAIKLGGIEISHDRELKAHSDGDVVIHALCDALLGALGLGDIGQLFPDSDPAFANIDSRELLRTVYSKVLGQGFRLGNADVTILAEAPRVAAHSMRMREVLAMDMHVLPTQVSIKATTLEGLGELGQGEGIAAQAIVLLEADS